MSLISDGERIYLRKLERKDLTEEYLSWLNDRGVNRFLDVGWSSSTMKDVEEYYEKIGGSKNNRLFAVIERDLGKHIGNVRLGPINWDNRNSSMGIMIGNREFIGKGFGPEAIKLLVTHAFEELELHKLFLQVISDNKRAIEAYKKVGFAVVGKMKDHSFLGGKYHDVIIMELINEKK